MKKLYLIILSVLIFGTTLKAQRVTNVEAHASGNNITVGYKIKGAKFYQKFDVSLYVSRDGGHTFAGPLKHVTGDVGKGVTGGAKSITWDVLNEIPVLDEEFVFDVRANAYDEDVKSNLFIQYTGNMITPLGARFGILGKTGFYVEARTSGIIRPDALYEYTNGIINNYDRPGYYEFSDANGYDALSVSGGLTFQANWTTFFYLGGGYGFQKYRVEFELFDYADNSKTGNEWAESTSGSYCGAEVAAGIILKPGNFILSAGATALNMELFNFTAGVGYAF